MTTVLGITVLFIAVVLIGTGIGVAMVLGARPAARRPGVAAQTGQIPLPAAGPANEATHRQGRDAA